MIIHLDNTIEGYRNFIRIKQLPRYEIRGRLAVIPDEYAGLMGHAEPEAAAVTFRPKAWLFDYQKAIVATAIRKRKFAIFADCGLGKTPMLLEFARHVHKAIPNKPVLIVSPLMVVPQTIGEAERFYGGKLKIERVAAKDLAEWRRRPGGRIGITNSDALTDETPAGDRAGLILDDSSML